MFSCTDKDGTRPCIVCVCVCRYGVIQKLSFFSSCIETWGGYSKSQNVGSVRTCTET